MSALIIIIVVSVLAVGGYVSSLFLGNDNAVEETCEQMIESQTGVDVDLTPASPEETLEEDAK